MPVNLTAASAAASDHKLIPDEEAFDRAVELIFLAERNFWRAAERPLAESGLGPAHYRALAAIRRAEGQPVISLRHRLGVRKQSLARVLVDLRRAGFIERNPGVTDRRNRLLALTAKGREAERAASAALREKIRQVYHDVGPHGMTAALLVLRALARRDGPEHEERG